MLLLVQLAAGHHDWLHERAGIDGDFTEIVDVAGSGRDEHASEFEGALGAAAAAEVRDEAEVRALQALAAHFEEPPPTVRLGGAERGALDRLLERLAGETVAAGRSPDARGQHGSSHSLSP